MVTIHILNEEGKPQKNGILFFSKKAFLLRNLLGDKLLGFLTSNEQKGLLHCTCLKIQHHTHSITKFFVQSFQSKPN
jgi:hypothetical protein